MPQLEFSLFPSQILWTVLSFSLLYLLISKLFLPLVKYKIQERKKLIHSYLDEAEALNEKSLQLNQKYESIIKEINDHAKIQSDHILEEFESQKERILKNLVRYLAKREVELIEKIDSTVDMIERKNKKESVFLAAFLIEKITSESADIPLLQDVINSKE